LGVTSKERLDAPVFDASLMFPGSNVGELTLADFIVVHLEFGIDDDEIPGRPIIALLGRAALTRYVMIYSGPESWITLMRRQ